MAVIPFLEEGEEVPPFLEEGEVDPFLVEEGVDPCLEEAEGYFKLQEGVGLLQMEQEEVARQLVELILTQR